MDLDNQGMVLSYLNNQKGFISIKLLMGAAISGIILTTLLIGVGMGIKMKAHATYDWYSEAMEFAARAANMDGDKSMVSLREEVAKQNFINVFAKITNCSISGNSFQPVNGNYAGPIKLKTFTSVSPGDSIPGGTANQPGYLAEIEVPIFGGGLPVVGNQYISVPMKYFAVVKSSEI